MQCEKCHAELEADAGICLECGEIITQNVEGFSNTKDIQRKLKSMVDKHGIKMIANDAEFVALVNDYIPEYDKERNLLMKMCDDDLLMKMYLEQNHEMAIMHAKEYMLGKLFLSQNAAEFVICCFTYMLGWAYVSPLREKEPENENKVSEKKKTVPLNIEAKVLYAVDAAKYRLFSNVTIPEGYTKIDRFAFDKFGFLKTVRLPSTMLCIGEYAFSECKKLKSIDLPESVRIIKAGAFSQCAKLVVIDLPKGILEIEDNTFEFCQNLEVVEIPNTVGSIGAGAFQGCEKLRKIFLPDSVKYIETGAFAGCRNLVITCYENSYVHKYCLSMGILTETMAAGNSLRAKIRNGGI